MVYFRLEKNDDMKAYVLIFLFLCFQYGESQILEPILVSEGYGDAAPYTNRQMLLGPFDGDFVYGSTRKIDPVSNNPRSYIVKWNLNDGTTVIYDTPIFGVAGFFSLNGDYLYFKASDRLYRMDKVSGQIEIVANDCGEYFFFENNMMYESQNYPYTLRIVNLANLQATEILPTVGLPFAGANAFYHHNESVYFWGINYVNSNRRYGVYRYNFVSSTLTPLVSQNCSGCDADQYQEVGEVQKLGDNLIYLVKYPDDNLHYISVNLTTGTLVPEVDFNTEVKSMYSQSFPVNTELFMPTLNGVYYKTDGTSPPEISSLSGFFPNYFVGLRDYFVEKDGIQYTSFSTDATGFEFGRTDGTAAGTYIVKDFVSGPAGSFSNPGSAFLFGDNIYFSARLPSSDKILYRSDGTEEGTAIFYDFSEDPVQEIGNIKGYGDYIYFRAVHDGANHLYRLSVANLSASETNSTKVVLYPNPAKSTLHFASSVDEVCVFSSAGNKVVVNAVSPVEIDVSGLTTGIYLIKFRVCENWQTKKVVIH